MINSTLPGLIVFGVLLAIALFGLVKANSTAARNYGSGPTNFDATGRIVTPSGLSGSRQ